MIFLLSGVARNTEIQTRTLGITRLGELLVKVRFPPQFKGGEDQWRGAGNATVRVGPSGEALVINEAKA